MSTLINTILLAGLGYRIWLAFNKNRDDYLFFRRVWHWLVLPLMVFTFIYSMLPDAHFLLLTSTTLITTAAMWAVRVLMWGDSVHVDGAAAHVIDDAAVSRSLAKPFDPEQYINIRKGIFVGLDSRRQPVYLPHQTISKNHIEILGESGVGKSSLAGVLLSQLATAGETVIIFDPKNDRNLAGALARVGKRDGFPVHVIDMRPNVGTPQVNPFAGCREDQVDELLQVALELGKTGDAGVDFYRGKDREAAGFLAAAMADGNTSMLEIIEKAAADERVTEQENLWRELRAVGKVKAFHTTGGLDLVNVLSQPGILYVIGSTTKLEVVAAQKLLLQRVLQIVDERDDQQRPISIFLDELKYILSPSALRAAGTIRDRNCHLFFAHQSLGDLADCPGLNANAVKGAIWGNCGIKVVYKMLDGQTARELETLAGTTAVTATSASDNGDKRNISQRVERGLLMAAHVFTNLPKPVNGEASVGVVFGLGTAWYLSTRWIQSGPAPAPVAAPLEVRGQATQTADAGADADEFGDPSQSPEADSDDEIGNLFK